MTIVCLRVREKYLIFIERPSFNVSFRSFGYRKPVWFDMIWHVFRTFLLWHFLWSLNSKVCTLVDEKKKFKSYWKSTIIGRLLTVTGRSRVRTMRVFLAEEPLQEPTQKLITDYILRTYRQLMKRSDLSNTYEQISYDWEIWNTNFWFLVTLQRSQLIILRIISKQSLEIPSYRLPRIKWAVHDWQYW